MGGGGGVQVNNVELENYGLVFLTLRLTSGQSGSVLSLKYP